MQNLKNKEKSDFKLAFIPIMTLICIIGLLQKFGINFIDINDNLFVDRIYSTVGNPNTLGFLTAISVLICIQLKKRYLLLIPIFLTTLLLTESRSAILALAAGICTIGILSENKKFRIATICSVISVIAVTIIIFDLTNFRSLFSRFYIWEATLEFLYKNPLNLIFGADLSLFSQNIYPYLNPNYFKYEPLVRYLNSAHNIILVAIYNYGIIAFSVLIFLLGKLTKKIKNKSILPVLMLILIFALLNNFFVESIIIGLIVFSVIELKSSKYINVNKFNFVLLLFVIFNSYQIYYIVQFENKINKVYDNLFETDKLNNSLQELHEFAPYSNTVQNFILTFNEFETKESEYIKDNIEYQISNYNLKELSDYFYKVKKSNRLNAIELMVIYNRANHLNSLLLKTELQKYFLQVYPNQIDQKGKLYKENKFVFKELNLIP